MKKSQTINHESSEPEIDLWRFVVLLSSFLTMVQIKLPITCYGIMYSKVLMNSNISSTTVAWIFNLSQFFLDTTAVFMGPLCDQFGWRKMNFTAGLILGFSTIFSGFIESPYYFFITYSILTGVALGASHAICSFIVPAYFKKSRSFAVGLVYSGLAIADFVTPPIVYYFQQCYGERSALFLVGALLLHVCAAAMVFHPVEWHIKIDKHKELSLHSCEEVTEEKVDKSVLNKVEETATNSEILFSTDPGTNKVSAPKETRTKQSNTFIAIRIVARSTVNNMKFLKQFRTLVITFSSSMTYVSLANNFMLLPFSLKSKGFQMETIVWCLSCVGIVNVISRLVVTALADILGISAKWYFMGALLSFAISLIGFSYSKSYTWIMFFIVMFGIGVGISVALVPLLIIEFMGLEHLPKVYGVAGFMQAIAFLVVGPIIGVIRDATQDYDLTIQLLSFIVLLAFLPWCFMPMAIAYDKRRSTEITHF